MSLLAQTMTAKTQFGLWKLSHDDYVIKTLILR